MNNNTTATPTCPQCQAPMRQRHGAKGAFLGCTRYPECKGTRSLSDGAAPAKVEALGPNGALVTDLRSASGHIGKAIDILRRRQAEIDALIDERDGVTF